jgi:4a-hydroxytetrahydrobiopterin dehydratase
MVRLSDDEVRAALSEGLPGWSVHEGAIHKTFVFPGFRAAIAFIDRLAEAAIAARHHPDLENHYNRVVVSLTTHDEGGVTPADVALAIAIERVAEPSEDAGA